MTYLLDTNVVSELRKGSNCDPGVAEWGASVDPEDIFLSVLTLGEIRRGIERVRRRDPAFSGRLENWLSGMETFYAERILPVTAAIADRWGRLPSGQALLTADGLLAATCIEHKLTLVTRNTADFANSGVNTLNPFGPARMKR